MKIFISADMEGISGVSSWEEVNPEHTCYSTAQMQMTLEVAAACEGAMLAGAKEIWVRDAHWAARNILSEKLPAGVKLIRGWSKHPYLMVQGIDSTFDAAIFVGYHSHAGSGANPLAHTIETHITSIRVNGELISEFRLYAGAAALENVPVVFLSGDLAICEDARKLCPQMVTVPILEGIGASTVSVHPADSPRIIREGVQRALSAGNFKNFPRLVPQAPYAVEVSYKLPADAYKFSFYPGAKLIDEHTVVLKAQNWFDVLRDLLFICSS